MDSGVWYRWRDIEIVGRQELPLGCCPIRRYVACVMLAVWPALGTWIRTCSSSLYCWETITPRGTRASTSDSRQCLERGDVWAHFSGYSKTHCVSARICEEDAVWMPASSQQTKFTDLDSIFVMGIVPGGYEKQSRGVRMCPTCRFSAPIYGLGKVNFSHGAVIVLNKIRTCKTLELYSVASSWL